MVFYEIASPDMCAQISTKGAELQELKVSGGDYNWVWPGKAPWQRTAPILFPIVGKLKNDLFRLNGQKFHLGQHGFARDSEFTVVEKSQGQVVLRLQAGDDTLKVYPFLFRLDIVYAAEGKSLKVVYIVENCDQKTMYFNIGWHPAFVLPGQGAGGALSLRGLSASNKFNLLDDGLLGHEAFYPEFQGDVLPLTAESFIKDALVFLNSGTDQVSLGDDMGNLVTVRLGQAPHLGVWTKDITKFLCIEPWWGYADSAAVSGDLSVKPGIQTLAPGDIWTYSMAVEVRSAGES